MAIKIDFSNFYQDSIGSIGISESTRKTSIADWRSIYRRINEQRERNQIAFMQLPYMLPHQIQDIKETVESTKERCDTLVVVGIGGSLLGAEMLYSVLKKSIYHKKNQHFSRVYFLGDTTDPTPILNLLAHIDLEHTAFNIVSKSGSTMETIAIFEIIRDRYKKAVGTSWPNYFIFTTETTNNYLFQTAVEHEIPVFGMREDLGGRFSVLSPVGLFPAAFAGIDIQELLDGAAKMDAHITEQGSSNDALEYAWLHYMAATEQYRLINVLFTYGYGLEKLGWWWRQLWAESLGKKHTLTGQEVRVGLTPVVSIGPADQHSQLQLYNEGPLDKTITFLGVTSYEHDLEVEHTEDQSLSFIGGKLLSEILAAEREATRMVLTETGQLNISIMIDVIDEVHIGGLIYFFELVTIYLAGFFNINPFDQPGVESSKQRIRQLLKEHD
ncbi:glucose-6-phosphate isomerase [candidate division WWE3 bacterium]|nr:glucose-6-phosphate isomerase [candidate division WWE3 bacterium]